MGRKVVWRLNGGYYNHLPISLYIMELNLGSNIGSVMIYLEAC